MSEGHVLSKNFMQELKQGGILHPILTRVKEDQTLMLAIRDGYINIYYRGGNILRVTEHSKSYRTFFDEQFNKSGQNIPNSPVTITNKDDAQKWVASFPDRKNIMDKYFSSYGKAEREFQQLVSRENNYSSISKECEYFVSDIEVADLGARIRFDIMAIRWLVSDHKKGGNCKAALIEMKYGDRALGGKAGLLKHLKDMESLISDTERYKELLLRMESRFNQLDELGLLKFNRGTSCAKVKLDVKDKPEVIFILANHNPRSSKLKEILSDIKFDEYNQSELFDLRFYVASFAGYGLHKDSMRNLDEFRKLCEVKKPI